MKEKDNKNLVLDGNAFYEIDEECMRKGINREHKANDWDKKLQYNRRENEADNKER